MSFMNSLIWVINTIAWVAIIFLVLGCVAFVIDIFMTQPELLRGMFKVVCFVVAVFTLASVVFFVSNISCVRNELYWQYSSNHNDLDAGTQ